MGITESRLENRIGDIISSLSSGMSRDELAQMYNHKDRQAIDQYMRRHGYVWDAAIQNYRHKGEHTNRVGSTVKTIDVIAQFKKPGADPREVAKRTGFVDHKKMAEYMQARGYTWDNSKCNYVATYAEEDDDAIRDNMNDIQEQQQFAPIDMRVLAQLAQLANGAGNSHLIDQGTSRIPRYILQGVRTMKSFQISSSLAQAVTDYCKDRNITQREVVEVALVECLRKYGYHYEVDAILKS